MDDSLKRFVHDALAKQIPRAEIEAGLAAAGWPRDEIRSALARYAEVDFPVPVPRPARYLSAREAFVYLVLFTLLYLSSWSLGALLFQFINRAYPALAVGSDFVVGNLRWSVAMLVIAFPGYLFLSRRAYAAARRDPEKRQSKVRKWLTYLTLFVAAGVLMGDLISLVYNFLEGELTARFLLKVATVAAIAGSVLVYYLWDLRQDDLEPERIRDRHLGVRLFAAAVTAVVVVALGFGFYLAGTPGRARELALDASRIGHLMGITQMIDRFWVREERLPRDLEELQNAREVWLESIEDPVTGARYPYRIIGDRSYELCAVFDTESEERGRPTGQSSRYQSGFWAHGIGESCFAVVVEKEP